jgi:nuclease-like protein
VKCVDRVHEPPNRTFFRHDAKARRVIGFLREAATHGEKETLKLLRQNLPKDFTVYVESPIYKERDIRYPDFVVVTNYGVIMLEVKDWVTIVNANPNLNSPKPRPYSSAKEAVVS